MKLKHWNLTRALKQAEKDQEQYEPGEVIALQDIPTSEVLKMWFDSQEDA